MEQESKFIHAPIFIGTRSVREDGVHFCYEKAEFPVEASIVNEHMSHNYSGMFFYIGLQMCWLVTAKYGLFSPFGGFGALIGLIALWRLYVMVAKRSWQRKHPSEPLPKHLFRDDDLMEEASEIIKEQKAAEYQQNGKKVLSLKEYRKLAS